MGLLDDAIREHLELKRRRGADPGEVAREQREALEAASGESAGWDGEPGSPDEAFATGTGEVLPAGAVPSQVHPPEAVEAHPDPGFSSVGQETAELDMQAVLDEDHEGPTASSEPVFAGPARGIPRATAEDADSLDWEMPDRAASQPPAHDAYHEQTAGGGDQEIAPEHWDPESSPQELREAYGRNGDIPAQERLSFE